VAAAWGSGPGNKFYAALAKTAENMAALTGGLVFAPGRFTFNSETKIIYAKYDAGAYPAEGVRQAECAFPVPETYSLMVNLNSLFDVIGISRRWA